MRTDDSEVVYLQKRIAASLAMANAATDECAAMAHKSLAILYGRNLKALLRAMDPPGHRQVSILATQGAKAVEPSKMRGTLRLPCPA